MTHPVWRIVSYGAVFFCVTSFTIFWTRFSGGLALVWPGTAIGAALFLALPRADHAKAFVVLVALNTLATSLFGFGPGWALPLSLVNVFEAWFIAWLLVRCRPQRDYVDSEMGIVALGFLAGLVGPATAAVLGAAIVTQIVGGSYVFHALSWLVGHGLGTLLAMPLALLLAAYKKHGVVSPREGARLWPFIGMILLTVGVSAIAFLQSTVPSLFLPVVPLVFASFRFGRFGASIAVLIISLAAAGSLGMEQGVFAGLAIALWQKALFVQFYLATLLLISLPVAVALKQRQRFMEELVDREAMQRLIADHSDDALLHLDQHGKVRFASPSSSRLSGHEENEGLHLGAFFSDFDHEVIAESLETAADHPGRTEIIERSVERDGKTRWLEAKLRAIESSKNQASAFVVTIRDVTNRKLEEIQASFEARTDALTGLPNRRAFLDILETRLEVADKKPFAFALIDLDHFKRVNDAFGHTVGDNVLKEIAEIMRKSETDDCSFARLGGEEFGMIATGPALENASSICERLRLDIEQHAMTDVDGGQFSITASIGIASIAEKCSTSMAMQAADGPLYSAKASGRNCVRRAQGLNRFGHHDEPVRTSPIAIAN